MDRKRLLEAVNHGFDHNVRDPLWKDIALDASFKRLYLTPAVQKLDRIRQNGPACHIYPGSVHTRLAHSLGVYHTGRLILRSLLRFEQPDMTVVGVRSFLAACLLHDIGHFPYAHSLKELSMKEHEELACELIDTDRTLRDAITGCGADATMVKAIIDKNLEADKECMVYRNILSGALDPDKLDYLNRDAFYAGVPYGLQDNGYIIQSMRLYEGRIALDAEALGSLEHLLFSKYLMYRNVYWHKGVRSATAMIKKALLMGLSDKVISFDDLYFLDDWEFDRIPDLHPSYEPFTLIRAVDDNQLLVRVWERQYVEGGRLETECADLFGRLAVESWLYEELRRDEPSLRPYEVVIDIQEPVSFESDTMMLGEEVRPFHEMTRLFRKDVTSLFTSSLRTVSVYAPPSVGAQRVKEVIDSRYE